MASHADKRQRRTKFTAYILFGAIIIVFIFWGVQRSELPTAGYAAVVNNTVISVGDFRRALEQQMQFYARIFGNQFDMNAQRTLEIRRATLDRLISQELLVQGAQRQGLGASDAEVAQQIFDIPAFQRDGRFQRDAYNNYLSYMRLSPTQFETELRKDIILKDVRQIFETVARPMPEEVALESKARSTKVDVEYLTLDTADAERNLKVSNEEAKKFIESEGSDKKIEEYYNSNLDQFVKPGEVHARHILIKSAAGKDQEALTKIQEVRKRLDSEPFDKVAKEVSEDAGSKANGGDLGFFGKGRMVEAFEKAAFTLPVGKISEPVKTNYGYHLIEVLEKKGGESKTVDQARLEIAKILVSKEKSTRWMAEFEKALTAESKEEQIAAVNRLVKEANLKWESTGLFDAGAQFVPKLGNIDGLVASAFSLSKDEPYPKKLFRNGTKAHVIRHKSVTSDNSGSPTEEISDLISRNRAQDFISSWEKTLEEKAKIHRNLELVVEQ